MIAVSEGIIILVAFLSGQNLLPVCMQNMGKSVDFSLILKGLSRVFQDK